MMMHLFQLYTRRGDAEWKIGIFKSVFKGGNTHEMIHAENVGRGVALDSFFRFFFSVHEFSQRKIQTKGTAKCNGHFVFLVDDRQLVVRLQSTDIDSSLYKPTVFSVFYANKMFVC